MLTADVLVNKLAEAMTDGIAAAMLLNDQNPGEVLILIGEMFNSMGEDTTDNRMGWVNSQSGNPIFPALGSVGMGHIGTELLERRGFEKGYEYAVAHIEKNGGTLKYPTVASLYEWTPPTEETQEDADTPAEETPSCS